MGYTTYHEALDAEQEEKEQDIAIEGGNEMAWIVVWTPDPATGLPRRATLEAKDVFQAIVRATVASNFSMDEIRGVSEIKQ